MAIIQKNFPAWSKGENVTLTKSQWLIYYYLIANSYGSAHESHFYIYKKDIKTSEMKEMLGIKSTNTIYKAFETLMEKGILYYDELKKAYLIYVDEPYATFDIEIIKTFMHFKDYFDPSLMLRMYSLFSYLVWRENQRGKKVTFTINQVTKALNTTLKTLSVEGMYIILGLWNILGLIELSKREITNNYGTKYTEFTILKIAKTIDNKFAEIENDHEIGKIWKRAELNQI